VNQSSPKFLPSVRGTVVNNAVFRLSIAYSSRIYSRSKSEVVRNRAECFDVFCPPKFQACWPQNLDAYSDACLVALHIEKFHVVTLPGPKVITADTLNFKPIFEFLLLQIIIGRTPVSGEVWSSKPPKLFALIR